MKWCVDAVLVLRQIESASAFVFVSICRNIKQENLEVEIHILINKHAGNPEL